MNKPGDNIINEVAPAHDVEGLPIQDSGIRNVAAALHDGTRTLRIPRGGPYDVALVATVRHYDGANGGKPSVYLGVWLEFQANGSRWRTSGVTVQDFEAARVARDLVKRKPSKPGKSEPSRAGGKVLTRDDSALMGAPVGEDGFLLYVRSVKRGLGKGWARTRGVEISKLEAPIIAMELKKLASSAA